MFKHYGFHFYVLGSSPARERTWTYFWRRKCVTLRNRDLSQHHDHTSCNKILNETIKCRNSITLYIHFYLFCQTWILQHGVNTFRTVPLWYLFSLLVIHSNACWMKPFLQKSQSGAYISWNKPKQRKLPTQRVMLPRVHISMGNVIHCQW